LEFLWFMERSLRLPPDFFVYALTGNPIAYIL
jgi:hypothetical protein